MYIIYTHIYRVYNITMSFLAILSYLSETLNCQGTSRLAKWHISSLWRPEPRQIEGKTMGKRQFFEKNISDMLIRTRYVWFQERSGGPSMSQHVPACPSMSQHVPAWQMAPADHAREVCWPSVMAPYLVSQIKHRDLKVPASTWARAHGMVSVWRIGLGCRWSQYSFSPNNEVSKGNLYPR